MYQKPENLSQENEKKKIQNVHNICCDNTYFKS
jgi:hypothetical protein